MEEGKNVISSLFLYIQISELADRINSRVQQEDNRISYDNKIRLIKDIYKIVLEESPKNRQNDYDNRTTVVADAETKKSEQGNEEKTSIELASNVSTGARENEILFCSDLPMDSNIRKLESERAGFRAKLAAAAAQVNLPVTQEIRGMLSEPVLDVTGETPGAQILRDQVIHKQTVQHTVSKGSGQERTVEFVVHVIPGTPEEDSGAVRGTGFSKAMSEDVALVNVVKVNCNGRDYEIPFSAHFDSGSGHFLSQYGLEHFKEAFLEALETVISSKEADEDLTSADVKKAIILADNKLFDHGASSNSFGLKMKRGAA